MDVEPLVGGGAVGDGGLEDLPVGLARERPRRRGPVRAGPGGGLGPGLRVGGVARERGPERVGVAVGDERARPARQHLARVEVRGRDDREPGGERVGQRPRADLVHAGVGRHVDVGGAEPPPQLVVVDVLVDEPDVVPKPPRGHLLAEPVAVRLPLALDDLGVRRAEDDVEHVGPSVDGLLERGDRELDALRRPEQPERQEHRPPFQAQVAAEALGRDGLGGRRPVRDHGHLRGRHPVHRPEQVPGRLRHHDDAGRAGDDVGERAAVRAGRVGEDRVERRHDGPVARLHEREDVAALGAPEDPELVLDAHDVGRPALAPHAATGGRVVGQRRLVDLGDHLGPAALAGRLADDRDHVAPEAGAEEARPEVAGEGREPAGAGRVGREDRRVHAGRGGGTVGLRPTLPARGPRGTRGRGRRSPTGSSHRAPRGSIRAPPTPSPGTT